MKAAAVLAIGFFMFHSLLMENKYTMLCLGDSYTIGEAVAEEERFPNQAAALLQVKGISFNKPLIIAKTGWTTDELAEAIIAEAKKQGVYIAQDRELVAALSRLDLEQEIPRELYVAVAVVLSWAYWLRRRGTS